MATGHDDIWPSSRTVSTFARVQILRGLAMRYYQCAGTLETPPHSSLPSVLTSHVAYKSSMICPPFA